MLLVIGWYCGGVWFLGGCGLLVCMFGVLVGNVLLLGRLLG